MSTLRHICITIITVQDATAQTLADAVTKLEMQVCHHNYVFDMCVLLSSTYSINIVISEMLACINVL